MSNQSGSDSRDRQRTDQTPSPERDQPRTGDPTANKSLSIADLMVLKTGRLPSSYSAGASEYNGFAQASEASEAQVKFDGERTVEVTRLLGNRSLSRYPSSQSEIREFTWSTTGGLDASANIGLGIPLGLKQHYQLRGADIKSREDNPKTKSIESQTQDFLKHNFILEDEGKLTEESKEQLNRALKALCDSEEPREVLSNSLHLARLYQQLGYIVQAVGAVALALQVNPNHLLATQIMKELERVHPQDIAFSPLTTPGQELSRASLVKRIINLSKGRVVVVGDLLIDELLEGSPERISREAPVLILEHVDTVHIPGGAANTAHNITALGGTCHAVGVCGEDEYHSKLANVLERHGITHNLIADKDRKTTVKTRILSKSHSLLQQLLRLDRISHEMITEEIAERVIARIEASVDGYDALILSDYKAGTITDSIVDACRRVSQAKGVKLIVDAQNRFERFEGCTLITPNQPDTEAALGYKLDSPAALERAGKDMMSLTKAEAILITRGPNGMALFRRHEYSPVELPVFNHSEVFDVTGAGDTVVATMTLALVTGASYVEAMALGNLAAGIVVRKSGTAVTSQKELLDALDLVKIKGL